MCFFVFFFLVFFFFFSLLGIVFFLAESGGFGGGAGRAGGGCFFPPFSFNYLRKTPTARPATNPKTALRTLPINAQFAERVRRELSPTNRHRATFCRSAVNLSTSTVKSSLTRFKIAHTNRYPLMFCVHPLIFG